MTGIEAVDESVRSFCTSAKPSITGIKMSLMMRSGRAFFTLSSASAPFSTASTSYPVCPSRYSRYSLLRGSSSATRILYFFKPHSSRGSRCQQPLPCNGYPRGGSGSPRPQLPESLPGCRRRIVGRSDHDDRNVADARMIAFSPQECFSILVGHVYVTNDGCGLLFDRKTHSVRHRTGLDHLKPVCLENGEYQVPAFFPIVHYQYSFSSVRFFGGNMFDGQGTGTELRSARLGSRSRNVSLDRRNEGFRIKRFGDVSIKSAG